MLVQLESNCSMDQGGRGVGNAKTRWVIVAYILKFQVKADRKFKLPR